MSPSTSRRRRRRLGALTVGALAFMGLVTAPVSPAAAQEEQPDGITIEYKLVACSPHSDAEKYCTSPYLTQPADMTQDWGKTVTWVAAMKATKHGVELFDYDFRFVDVSTITEHSTDCTSLDRFYPSSGVEEHESCRTHVLSDQETRTVELHVTELATGKKWTYSRSATATAIQPSISVESAVNGKDGATAETAVDVTTGAMTEVTFKVTNTSTRTGEAFTIKNIRLTTNLDDPVFCVVNGFAAEEGFTLESGEVADCASDIEALDGLNSIQVSVTADAEAPRDPLSYGQSSMKLNAEDISYYKGAAKPDPTDPGPSDPEPSDPEPTPPVVDPPVPPVPPVHPGVEPPSEAPPATDTAKPTPTAKATTTPPTLAKTGTESGPLALVAIGLLGLGVTAMTMGRKRTN